MGNQLSQCGNAQTCFDGEEIRLELTEDSGDRPEEKPRPAYAQGEADESPRDAMPGGTGGGHLSPRGPVGRNHSVQRSFGASSPAAGRGGRQVGTDADSMLEELRHMYGARQPADAASLAEVIVRERERERAKYLAGSGKVAGRSSSSRGTRGLEHEEDALVRSALDVVAQRYVNGGAASGNNGVNGALSGSHSTPRRTRGELGSTPRETRHDAPRFPEDVGPQTHFSRRKQSAPASTRAGGRIARGDGRSPGGAGALRSTGEMWGDEDWSHDSEDHEDDESGTGESADDLRRTSDYQRTPMTRPPRPPAAAGSSGRASRTNGLGSAADRCTMEEVLHNKYGITLEDMAACGCAPPPPQLLRLRMTEADWAKHLHRAGVDVYLQRTPRQGAPSGTPRHTGTPAPQSSGASGGFAMPGGASHNANVSDSAGLLRDMRMGRADGAEEDWRGCGDARTGRDVEVEIGHGAGIGMAHDRPPVPVQLHCGGGASGVRGGSGGGGPEARGSDLCDEVLPEGWKRYVSRTSGRPFYKNKATGATQWALPTREAEGV